MTHRLQISLVTLALLVPARGFAQTPAIPPDARVAFVSVQRISSESAPGKTAIARVTALQQQRTAELRAKQSALASLQQQMDRASAPDERARLSAQAAADRADLERSATQAQADLQNLQRDINTELRPKVVAVLNEILKGTHIEVVTNVDTTLLWAAPGLDLTNAVIERLNAGAASTLPSPATAPPPGAPAPR